ncbi:MAG: TRAP transporter substrate-binding protein [Motiliproteus sp.]|nr:TRAP transporter substrate-binding protein [Motiliproteus sp.]MCW9053854.1 TRAP transporter substrate-binding protein [Motiliproteus sp.]
MSKIRVLLIVFLVTGYAGVALAQQWQLASPYPKHNFHTENILWFSQEVERVTNGALKIEVHPNGQLFRHPDIWMAVSNGQLEAGELLVSSRLSEDIIYSIDAVPFLANSYHKADKLYRVSRPFFDERLNRNGLMLLYSVPWPPQGLYLREPIKDVDDLRGRSFRTYNESTNQLAQMVGGVANMIEYADLTDALSQGNLGGMFTSSTGGVEVKAWRNFGYFYDLQAWLPRNMVVVNKQAFDKLSPAIREQVREVAKRAEARGVEASQERHAFHKQVLKEHGVVIVSPEPRLLEEFQMVGSTLVSKWIKKAGQDGAQLIADYVR